MSAFFRSWRASPVERAHRGLARWGSIIAGVVVPPIVAGVARMAAAVRGSGVPPHSSSSPSASNRPYRVTTLVVHPHRPAVARLEKLAVDASYPSGTHGGVDRRLRRDRLLAHLSFRQPRVRRVGGRLPIPLFVAPRRMYRGMHHPLDAAGGALLGIAALACIVFACRARRGPRRRPRMTQKVAVIAHSGKTLGGGLLSFAAR